MPRGLPSFNDLRQGEVVRALLRMGGVPRPGKGSHIVVTIGGVALSIPHGIVKRNTLMAELGKAGIKPEEFARHL